MKLYWAGPYGEAKRIEELARSVHDLTGQFPVSTWHSYALPADSVDDSVLAAGMWQDISQLERADVLIAITSRGAPRATFSEIGWALACGKSVVWAHGQNREGMNVFAQHGLVRRIADDGNDPALVVAVIKALRSIEFGEVA